MRKVIIIQFIVLIGLGLIFIGLQKPVIYNNSLGLISKNYQKKDGEIKLVDIPYEQLTNDNYIHWDGVHYFGIRNYGYNIKKAGGDYIFAFFPLFPFIWKITYLPPLGIIFLNYLFFSISIFILLKLFSKRNNYQTNIILSLSLPSIIIFLIPYTEATFMLMLSIAIYGFMKNKYWVFFIGFFLASLSRPSFTFLLLSVIGTELFFLLKHRSIKTAIKNIFLWISPLLTGTLAVSLIQYLQGSGNLFKFISVQKYWKDTLSVPHNLRDWSHEGFSINMGIIFLIFIPLLVLFFQVLYKQLNKKSDFISYKAKKDYILILSILYIIGNSLFILSFRAGSLRCLFRYTLCSPFFYILLYLAFDYLRNIHISFRLFFITTLSLLGILMLGLVNYSTYWNFSDFGIFVFIAALYFWLFQDLKANKIYKIGIIFLLILNLVWTTYLFNIYLVDGYIFA